MQYRSANTLPREIGLFRADDGQIYASSTPSPELLALRGHLTENTGKATIGDKGRTWSLPTANGGICEILLDIDAQKARSVEIELGNGSGDRTTMLYDPAAHTLSFDRTKSGLVDFSQDFPAVIAAPTFEKDGKTSLRIFIDRSSIELFGNNGQFAMTNLVFPTEPYSTLSVKAAGGKAKVSDLKIYSIETK